MAITKNDINEMDWLAEIIQKAVQDSVYSDRYRLCATIVGKNFQTWGFNSQKTHPLAKRFQKNKDAITLHAEIDCIRECLRHERDLSRATLYVGRLKYDHAQHGELIWGMAKPCKGCMQAIEAFNIKRVVYSTDDGFEELVR
jgi:deoxycytidylate deaminase